MFQTLYSRLLVFSLVLSLGGILFVGIAVFFGFQETFSDYVETRREEQIIQAVEQVENDYIQNGAFTNQSQMTLHRLTMHEDIHFQVYSAEEELLIDSSHMNQHQRGQMRRESSGVMMGDHHMDSESFELFAEGEPIGTMFVYYPATFAGTDNQFLADFSRYLLLALVVMTCLAVLFSFIFSKQLSKGIKQIGGAMKLLKNHRHALALSTDHSIQEIRDLSEGVNELARSLEKSEKLRKQFTSDLAHELRTPLSTLRSQLEAFRDGVLEVTPERLEQSYLELMRLVRLVNEMEELHAAENPRLKLNIEKLHSAQILKSLYERFNPSFEEKGIDLKVDTEKSYVFAADPDRFTQIMTNLLNNAWKFTDTGKKVEITVDQDENFTTFNIMDEGKGMSEEELQNAFERFYRGEKSRNRERGGLGIGLSIVKALVEAHRGKLNVKSEPGKGTTISVSFPNQDQR
ncbi:sensor histidine kinase [Salipaludibacillus aurantiacus]|uniref:histidine kinase n=1 Tax=Salipaludibacillus aurantiacus TaxID=1601833 RepID=A0A1H9V1C0_9BACI|nr:HAMP domain-containing sensor histidine kinase [Salipaludibacillus aurantiacus]SES15077.1 His Kinase A (phospho-acceptor) domain-containing protein [Salipaludibacillus aurantiacus]